MPPMASMRRGKFSKLTSTTWLILMPRYCSTVWIARPRRLAALGARAAQCVERAAAAQVVERVAATAQAVEYSRARAVQRVLRRLVGRLARAARLAAVVGHGALYGGRDGRRLRDRGRSRRHEVARRRGRRPARG